MARRLDLESSRRWFESILPDQFGSFAQWKGARLTSEIRGFDSYTSYQLPPSPSGLGNRFSPGR